jgi:hypothetical protein
MKRTQTIDTGTYVTEKATLVTIQFVEATGIAPGML